jgi:hypothetical protein
LSMLGVYQNLNLAPKIDDCRDPYNLLNLR